MQLGQPRSDVPILIGLIAGFQILLGFGNGIFMLAAPETWYSSVPGVARTGFFNQHFIRDIGILYVFIGLAFAVGFVRPAVRVEFWGGATLWLTGHAIFHLLEVATGICSPEAIPVDFPAVTFPALVGLAATAWAWRARSRAALFA